MVGYENFFYFSQNLVSKERLKKILIDNHYNFLRESRNAIFSGRVLQFDSFKFSNLSSLCCHQYQHRQLRKSGEYEGALKLRDSTGVDTSLSVQLRPI